MAEVPKDAAARRGRGETSPGGRGAARALRAARAARRRAAIAEAATPTPSSTSRIVGARRLNMLRRLLDEIDPAIARRLRARRRQRSRGERPASLDRLRPRRRRVRVAAAAPPETTLAVLFDLPASREELREARRRGRARDRARSAAPGRRACARSPPAARVKPLTLPDSGRRARDDDAKVRAELRAVLDDGQFGRELLAIEPLLDDFDGAEVAAAALSCSSASAKRIAPAHRARAGAARRAPRSAGRWSSCS